MHTGTRTVQSAHRLLWVPSGTNEASENHSPSSTEATVCVIAISEKEKQPLYPFCTFQGGKGYFCPLLYMVAWWCSG